MDKEENQIEKNENLIGKEENLVVKILKENIIYILLLAFTICALIFLQLNYRQQLILIDETVMKFIEEYLIIDANTALMKYITFFGSWPIPIAIIVLFFVIFKDKKVSVFMGMNYGWTNLICFLMKRIVKRERPLTVLIERLSSYSFPSAHAMGATAFYLMLYYFLQRQYKNVFVKAFLLIITLALILLIGASRVYLSAHFLTDVIAGFILGLICVLMFINIYKRNFGEEV